MLGHISARDAAGTRGSRDVSHLVKLSLPDFSVCMPLFMVKIDSELTVSDSRINAKRIPTVY